MVFRVEYNSYNRTTTQETPVNYTDMSLIEMTITNIILTIPVLAGIIGYNVIVNKKNNNKK